MEQLWNNPILPCFPLDEIPLGKCAKCMNGNHSYGRDGGWRWTITGGSRAQLWGREARLGTKQAGDSQDAKLEQNPPEWSPSITLSLPSEFFLKNIPHSYSTVLKVQNEATGKTSLKFHSWMGTLSFLTLFWKVVALPFFFLIFLFFFFSWSGK